MTARPKGEGRVYLRRSDKKQETSLESQLDWAGGRAAQEGVRLDADRSDLEAAKAGRLHRRRHLFLDNAVSGSVDDRRGLRALVEEALADGRVSHVFIHLRDRLGRPKEPAEMVLLERKLGAAGVTIVFSDKVVPPARRGEADIGQSIQTLVEYHQSGAFLNTLAERVLLAQRELARRGYWTGGTPPYGFARFLVGPGGEVIEKLPTGKRVRQPGHHVCILPDDAEKIGVWCMILEMKRAGGGSRRIAHHLNRLGIPSPGAGKVRTDGGVRHRLSGKWGPCAVTDLCRNEAIVGVLRYGRRSEGSHRRLGADGPRQLETWEDRDKSPRPVFNGPDVVVKAPAAAAFEPKFDPQAWREIQEKMDDRGKCQRGLRRAKDPDRYPVAGRVFDLTGGCGSLMYGRKTDGRLRYLCGRYSRSGGGECAHNAVDAEAVLRFTLRTLAGAAGRRGGKLRELLERRASREAARAEPGREAEAELLRGRVASLKEDVAVAKRRMATERDEARYEAIAEQFDQLGKELAAAEQALAERQAVRAAASRRTPAEEVEAALGLFDRIVRVAEDASARADVPPLLDRLGVKLGLTFGEVTKGERRSVRRLLGGVIAFGGGPLPVPPYGYDNCDDGPGGGTPDGPSGDASERECHRPAGAAPTLGDGGGEPVGAAEGRRRKGVSFTKAGGRVSRPGHPHDRRSLRRRVGQAHAPTHQPPPCAPGATPSMGVVRSRIRAGGGA